MSAKTSVYHQVEAALDFSAGVHAAAVKLYESKIPPTQAQISILSDCVDELHEFGQHVFAHVLDDLMVEWAGLLL